jgi:hypothetical protein
MKGAALGDPRLAAPQAGAACALVFEALVFEPEQVLQPAHVQASDALPVA